MKAGQQDRHLLRKRVEGSDCNPRTLYPIPSSQPSGRHPPEMTFTVTFHSVEGAPAPTAVGSNVQGKSLGSTSIQERRRDVWSSKLELRQRVPGAGVAKHQGRTLAEREGNQLAYQRNPDLDRTHRGTHHLEKPGEHATMKSRLQNVHGLGCLEKSCRPRMRCFAHAGGQQSARPSHWDGGFENFSLREV